MITRIVRLTIEPEQVHLFKLHFLNSSPKIRGFKGCTYLELFADVEQHNVLLTLSKWKSEIDLHNYRNSTLFKEIWKLVKPLFIAKPFAYSMATV